MGSRRTAVLILLGVLILATGAWLAGRPMGGRLSRTLVVYCAHDAEYSEPLLKEFERRTGISVLIRFDTEATKTLGLVNLLLREKSQPRCDVFWNNELLSTLSLKEQGVLQPYRGLGFARIPDSYKDPEGYWTGFAARLRVHIVNNDKLPHATAQDVEELWQAENLNQLAIAKPLYGTTLVHYSVLAEVWGLERLQAWHRVTRKRGLQEVNGNSTVKNLVAQGACQAGLTDTDDYFVARDSGLPVSMFPVKIDDRTICIPNCVALIAESRHPNEAQQLIDFLLSEETELKLAQSTARQVPLGPVDVNQLSPEVRELAEWAKTGYDLRGLGPEREACLHWLSSEYLGQ
ncbi:MAG: idiA [Planctomycetaceae bacterium]|nr:idiA [Planctomycetaceae bacterium]